MSLRLLSVVLAFLLDVLFGDPQWFPHPVRGIGAFIQLLEPPLRRLRNHRLAGVLLLFLVLAATCIPVALLLWLVRGASFAVQLAVNAFLLWTTFATRDLVDHCVPIYRALANGDLEAARRLLARIVSRQTAYLPEGEVARGCVESLAENLVDGSISPLFYALLGGPVAAFAFKAASTLDSMVGYRTERYLHFGWASARFDDVLNYVPARLTYLALPAATLFTGNRAARCLHVMRADGLKNPSPNSGIPEAGVAGALGIALGGPSIYQGVTIEKPRLNESAAPPRPRDIVRAVRLVWTTAVLFLLCGVGAALAGNAALGWVRASRLDRTAANGLSGSHRIAASTRFLRTGAAQ